MQFFCPHPWLTSRPSNSDFQNLFEPQAPDQPGLADLYRSLSATAYLAHRANNLPALQKEVGSGLGRAGSLMGSALTARTAKTQLLLAKHEVFRICTPSGAAHRDKPPNWALGSARGGPSSFFTKIPPPLDDIFYWPGLSSSDSFGSDYPDSRFLGRAT